MRLRKPEINELPALSALIMRSKALHGYDDAFMEACREELTLTPEKVAAGPVVVAELNGASVGVAQIMVHDDEWHLQLLFVDPGHLGSGLGRRMLEWAVLEARRMGATELFIEADPDAEPFYRKMGAKRCGEAPSESIPGRMLPLLVLALGEGGLAHLR
ncbi:MAG: GNAT family N-acetyltransferase [Pseudomonadota bacterium]